MSSHINPEIVAGVLDELQGQISAIRHGASILKDNPSDFAAFEEVHRFLFGIKTSALMAGLTTLSHIAHYQAEALEEIASGMLEWTPLTTIAFDTAMHQMDSFLLASTTGEADERKLLTSVVSAFRHMRGQSEAGVEEEVAGLLEQDSLHSEAVEAREAAARPAPVPAGEGWDFDSLPLDLIETFRMEASEHLLAIGDSLCMLDLAPNAKPVLADIRRSVHTLKGAAGSVGLRQLSSLAGCMEHLLDRVNDGAVPFQTDLLQLLLATFDTMSELTAGNEGSADLREAIVDLHGVYQMFDSPPAEQDPASADGFTSATEGWEEDHLYADLEEIFHEESAELLLTASAAMRLLEQGPVTKELLKNARRPIHTLKGAAGTVGLKQTSHLAKRLQFLLDGMEEDEIETSPLTLTLVQDAFPLVAALCDENNRSVELRRQVEEMHARFDDVESHARLQPEVQAQIDPGASDAIPADLADIFSTEAEELLVRIDESLKAFEATPEDNKPLDDLRRDVHTLKGAAASVGLRQFGHLAHRMEDLFDALGTGSVAPLPEVHSIFRDTWDAMAMMAAGADAELALPLYPRYSQLLDADQKELEALLDLDEAAHPPAPQAVAEVVAESIALPQPEAPPIAVVPSAAVPIAAPQPVSTPPAAAALPIAAARKRSGLTVRVPIERLDEMVHMISELVVNRSTFEQQLSAYAKEVSELQLSLARLKRISNRLDSDFEVSSFQSGYGHLAVRAVHAPAQAKEGREEFDPLELDRYTDFHLVSRDLSETSTDISTAANELSYRIAHFDSYLSRLGGLTSEIQDEIMRIRMVPLQSIASRLDRTSRSTSARSGKHAQLIVEGGQIEFDKSVIEEMSGPFEHIIRNAIDHGIESPEVRRAVGKPEQGMVRFHAFNQGTQIVIEITDDGGGLRAEMIRENALRSGLHTAAELDAMTADDIHALIFHPGFSTSLDINEISGRGVGMDVVRTAVNKLKGTIAIESEAGVGTKFIIRLPMSLAIMRVLMVRCNEERLAVPLASIHQVMRVDHDALDFSGDKPTIRIDDSYVPVFNLSEVLSLGGAKAKNLKRIPVLVFQFGDNPVAFAVDYLMEAREVVVKGLGDLLRRVPGISGATLTGDGSVVLIVEPADLVRISSQKRKKVEKPVEVKQRGLDVLVVDDSVSVRRVLSNLITNSGWTPTSAKDGVEALEILQRRGTAPDVILLDIEMPRMDGYDLTSILRNDEMFKHVPIIMLTSRSGEKHRRKAFELGATDYLVKPYQEETLLEAIRKVVKEVKPALAG